MVVADDLLLFVHHLPRSSELVAQHVRFEQYMFGYFPGNNVGLLQRTDARLLQKM